MGNSTNFFRTQTRRVTKCVFTIRKDLDRLEIRKMASGYKVTKQVAGVSIGNAGLAANDLA